MAFSMDITHTALVGGKILSKVSSYSSGARTSIEETVADSSTDMLVALTVDVTQVKAIYIVASVAMTFETNDGTTPTNTIALLAGVPYVWTTDSYDSLLLTGDVTALYMTNASGGAGTINIEIIEDPTV